jgi:hypothetical protein
LQSIEFTVVLAMCAFFHAAGWRVGVVFDGVQVYAKQEYRMSEHVLRRCEQAVLQTTGWKIELEEKPMDRGIDLRLLLARARPVAEDIWKQRYVERLLACLEKKRWKDDQNVVGVILERSSMRKELFEEWAGEEWNKAQRREENGQTESKESLSDDDSAAEMAKKVTRMREVDDWMLAVTELEQLALRDNESSIWRLVHYWI